MTNSISSIGIQLLLNGSLTSEQTNLSSLNEELASGKLHDNLTDYAPTDAKQIIDFQSNITQKQAYLASINTVQSRLSIYDTTMTDLESLTSTASSLASQNQSYNPATAAQIGALAKNSLLQVADDLNQEIGGRYIYAGTRYTSAPVSTDPTTLYGAPQATITDGSTLPDYDAQVPPVATKNITYGANLPGTSAAVGYTSAPTTVQVYSADGSAHSVSYSWTKTGANTFDLDVSSPDATYTTVMPFTFDSSTGALSSIADYASSSDAPSPYTVNSPTTTGSPASVSISVTFPPSGAQNLNLNFGTYGQTSGATAVNELNTVSSVMVNDATQDGNGGTTSNANAYTADSVLIDSNYSIKYGISSDNPSFQQLINGLRYMNAAVTAGQSGDTATYSTDMAQATSLLTTALAGIQTIHAGNAGNQNSLTQETTTQNSNISSFQDGLSSIQSADLTTVSTEITALETQLQASYSATGNIEKLSLVNYL